MKSGFKVFAPATIANVACGFDILGLAINAVGDEIILRQADKKGLHITNITGDKKQLSRTVEENPAGLAALRVLEHLGETSAGINLEIHRKIPNGGGLGADAAIAAAAAWAINCAFNKPLTKRELLPFALEGEALTSGDIHPDTVAPALLGGLMLSVDAANNDIHRVYTPPGLQVVVIHPNIKLLTQESRHILQTKIDFKTSIQQSANLAALVLAMQKGDIDLLGRVLKDDVVEPLRANLIPYFYEIKAAALAQGALGCSISGAGPAIFAICPNSLIAQEVETQMTTIYSKAKIRTKCYRSGINYEGAVRR